jgi:hypothetical protein
MVPVSRGGAAAGGCQGEREASRNNNKHQTRERKKKAANFFRLRVSARRALGKLPNSYIRAVLSRRAIRHREWALLFFVATTLWCLPFELVSYTIFGAKCRVHTSSERANRLLSDRRLFIFARRFAAAAICRIEQLGRFASAPWITFYVGTLACLKFVPNFKSRFKQTKRILKHEQS